MKKEGSRGGLQSPVSRVNKVTPTPVPPPSKENTAGETKRSKRASIAELVGTNEQPCILPLAYLLTTKGLYDGFTLEAVVLMRMCILSDLL